MVCLLNPLMIMQVGLCVIKSWLNSVCTCISLRGSVRLSVMYLMIWPK
jgi:hypothetical protein